MEKLIFDVIKDKCYHHVLATSGNWAQTIQVCHNAKRANWEEKLEQLIDEFKEINGENYRFVQLTMWARMIESQQWDSNKKLPPAAMICGSCSKEKPNSWDTTASALTNAAVTFVP